MIGEVYAVVKLLAIEGTVEMVAPDLRRAEESLSRPLFGRSNRFGPQICTLPRSSVFLPRNILVDVYVTVLTSVLDSGLEVENNLCRDTY